MDLRRASVLPRDPAAARAFDVIVVGAGINGAAVAREAALSGMKVLLLERGDLGGGTSSASSRLIHGGLRYLEYAEIGLVYESLAERERLLAQAPHLVQPLELCIPVYREARRKRWQIAAGLTLYDWLAVGQSVPRHRVLSRAALIERLPGVRREGLVGGASYYDAQVTYPERLVLENVRDAVDHGAVLLSYTQVTRIIVEQRTAVGVEWQTGAGEHGRAAAPLIVNCAGPWVDQVLDDVPHTRMIGGTKGSHLIVEPFRGAPAAGVYVEAGGDGRPFFILPWNGSYLIGTTDERFDGDPEEARIDDREWRYLIEETERVFPDAAPLAPRVLYTCSGVRPLPHRPRSRERAITRRHLIRRHRSAKGLYSIVGGKLTTHRALAEDVLRTLRAHVPRLPKRSPTRDRPLPGALDAERRVAVLRDVGAVFGAAHAERLVRLYGATASKLAALAHGNPDLVVEIAPQGPLVAELVHAIEHEWAVTLGDVLQRRCMIGLNADFGLQAAPAAAEWLRRLGFWDGGRAALEIDGYGALARRARARALTEP